MSGYVVNYPFSLGANVAIGSTTGGGGGGGTINGTIQATQVAYGTSTDTIGGENVFTYDASNNLLTVEKITTTGLATLASLSINSAYVFPTSDGASGQILITDGSGTLTFQDPATDIASYVADEAISIGDVLRFVTSSDTGLTPGRVIKSSATTEANGECIGVAKTSGTQGSSIQVTTNGNANILFGSAPASSSNGQTIYLDTTSGQATLTPPSASGNSVVKLGKLQGANGISSTPNCLLNIDAVIVIG